MDLLLSIPGIWDKEEAIYEVPEKVPRYFYRGEKPVVELLVKPYDENLVKDFRFLLPEDIPEEEFERLDSHTHIAFIAGTVEKNDDLVNMMHAAAEIVKTGGMAVRVESSKTALTAAEWLLTVKNPKKASLFKAFVGFLKVSNSIQSFGMQILGMPDARIPAGNDEYYAYNVLRNFLFMGYIENMQFSSGQLVTLFENEPEFKINLSKDDRDSNDLFYNVYGIWELSKQEAAQ